MNEKQSSAAFDSFAIVELFGHQRIAGRCTEQNIAGTNMLRVDVPETKNAPAFSKLFGSGAIYAINPVDEFIAKETAEQLQLQPVYFYNMDAAIQKYNESRMLDAPAASPSTKPKAAIMDDEAEDDDFNPGF